MGYGRRRRSRRGSRGRVHQRGRRSQGGQRRQLLRHQLGVVQHRVDVRRELRPRIAANGEQVTVDLRRE